jgi:hypothetical protein
MKRAPLKSNVDRLLERARMRLGLLRGYPGGLELLGIFEGINRHAGSFASPGGERKVRAALVAHIHVEPAGVALKAIETAFARPARHCSLHTMKDAAFGALVIAIAFHLKIREALGCLPRRIKLRLNLLYTLMCVHQFRLKASCPRLSLRDKLVG